MLWISDHGKAGAADWGAMQKLLADGYDVVTFDGRGLGETRMRYRAVSEDDPTLVAGDFDTAYVSPLSSVLADYVYNTLLTGRPYLLQMIEDVEIAARFARTAPEGDRSCYHCRGRCLYARARCGRCAHGRAPRPEQRRATAQLVRRRLAEAGDLARPVRVPRRRLLAIAARTLARPPIFRDALRPYGGAARTITVAGPERSPKPAKPRGPIPSVTGTRLAPSTLHGDRFP